MIATEDIKPISFIKNNTAQVLKQINETQRPIYITQNGEAKGVLIDTQSYEKLQNVLNLLKLTSLAESEIKSGKVKSQSEVFKRIEKKFNFNT